RPTSTRRRRTSRSTAASASRGSTRPTSTSSGPSRRSCCWAIPRTTASCWYSASASDVPGPFRLRPGPAGDLASYASTTPQGAPVHGHLLLIHDLPRPKGAAADVALTYPALADRLTRESGWRVVTASLRGAGDSAGDFSPLGWLDDLASLTDDEVPEASPRLMIGFGFGGVLALHMAARDDRVVGVACLGTPGDINALVPDP